MSDVSFKRGLLVQQTWPEHDRLVVEMTPHLGPEILVRPSDVGVNSLDELRQLGVNQAVDLICQRVGSGAWRNRDRALQRALDNQAAQNAPCRGFLKIPPSPLSLVSKEGADGIPYAPPSSPQRQRSTRSSQHP